ncbi:mechanosensitive ion channel protein [Bremerella cremea]|uniref:Mechanosensitive ion channel protein n=1 Tax=Bremerella cremea TaxID=1031537 RepID=A0A368KLL6_9BACT|nr:mechanosensitive ion channel domain-containing protein [Bremerella cremea]RCS40710.1 mechanosensitive ion channel protein [Bremerella cremea]
MRRIPELIPSFLLFLLLTAATGDTAIANEKSTKQAENSTDAYYAVEQLNQGVPTVSDPPDLSTPLATVENFLFACRDENFQLAAQSLNFALIPESKRGQAAEYARKFYYALNQRLWIDLEDLPDRPDGQMINRLGNDNPMAGKPRRSIRLGKISIDDWKEVRVRIQRVKKGDSEPVWLFSPQTVEKIPALYAAYGPSWIEQWIPAWAKVRLVGRVPLWEWVALFVFIVLGVGIGYLTQHLIGYAILHRQNKERMWFERLISALSLPLVFASAALAVYLLKKTFLSLTSPVNMFLDPLMLLIVVGAIAWLLLRCLDVATQFTMERYVNTLDDDVDGAQQGLLTKISVARRLVTVVAAFVVVGILLVQLNIFDAVGYGLLASAGVSTVILGIAAQPILGNLLAGLQIAMTQPVRIGDSVLFEGNWGHVEDIKFTYLTIRTWDKRRLIVPLQYLISQPVENWTKVSPELTRPIKVYVDYTTDVDQIREKFEQLATEHELWDERSEPTVQVTGCSEETMEIRALCHAKNPGDAWDLHCEMREKLIAFVQQLESGDYLPRERVRVVNQEEDNRVGAR